LTLLASTPAFQLAGSRPAAVPMRFQQAEMMQGPVKTAAGRLLAASTLALALNGATPSLTQAAVEPPAVVQQFGANFVADEAAELRDAQQKFLQERAKMAQEYDTDIESNYKSEEEVTDKKNIYVTIVTGLVAIAFIAPMVQFFYYTAGE